MAIGWSGSFVCGWSKIKRLKSKVVNPGEGCFKFSVDRFKEHQRQTKTYRNKQRVKEEQMEDTCFFWATGRLQEVI